MLGSFRVVSFNVKGELTNIIELKSDNIIQDKSFMVDVHFLKRVMSILKL